MDAETPPIGFKVTRFDNPANGVTTLVSMAAIREAVVAALPQAPEQWAADVRSGKMDETPLILAAIEGWKVGVCTGGS